MICRQWKAILKADRQQDYLNHLRDSTFPKLRALSGFVNASVLTYCAKEGTAVQVLTYWKSIESIKQFAGNDYTVAVLPETAQAMMVSFDSHALHSEVVLQS